MLLIFAWRTFWAGIRVAMSLILWWPPSGRTNASSFVREAAKLTRRIRLPSIRQIGVSIAAAAILATILYAVWEPLLPESLSVAGGSAQTSGSVAGGSTQTSDPLDRGTLASLMTIVIALLALGVAVVGGIGYKLLSTNLERKELQRDDIRLSDMLRLLSVTIYWQQYDALWSSAGARDTAESDPPPAPVRALAETALLLSERALRAADRVEHNNPGSYRARLLDAKNNVAFHLATLGVREAEALAIVQELMSSAPKFDDDLDWQDTSLWVLWRFSHTDEDKARARELAKNLLSDPRAASHSTQWRIRYKKLL